MLEGVGRLNMYAVKRNSNDAHNPAFALPNATHFLVRGDEQQSMDIIRLDDAACAYVIAVQSMSSFASYTLAVTLADNILELQSGVRVRDSAEVGDYDYFSFTPLVGKVVIIDLEVEGGDADLFVSTQHMRPNLVNRCDTTAATLLQLQSSPNTSFALHRALHISNKLNYLSGATFTTVYPKSNAIQSP